MQTLKEMLAGRNLFTVKADQSIQSVVNYMAENNIGLVPVLDATGQLVGVFSERDLVKRVIAKGLDTSATVVSEVMSTDLKIAMIDESYNQCMTKMRDAKIRHLIVVDGNNLAGVLSIRDLMNMEIKVQKETIEVLNNYIYSR